MPYIEEATPEERTIIEDYMNVPMQNVDYARKLIDSLYTDYFESSVGLMSLNSSRLEATLGIVFNVLSDAVLQYHLQIGDEEEPMVKPFLNSAERARQFIAEKSSIKA